MTFYVGCNEAIEGIRGRGISGQRMMDLFFLV